MQNQEIDEYVYEPDVDEDVNDIDDTKELGPHKPTEAMKVCARRTLKWKNEGRPGMTRVGMARANQIANGDNISDSTVLRMFSFFIRHKPDKEAEGFYEGEEGYPSRGRVAWDGWGGDPGFRWSQTIRDRIMAAREKKSIDETTVEVMNEQDMVVWYGGSVKATDDGKVKGYLVRFTDESKPDLEGDYFTKSCDFGRPLQVGDKFALNLYYSHGYDKTVGRKDIGTGMVEVTDAGLWYEGQIALSDDYQKMILQLAKQNRLGFSSGAAGHLVTRSIDKTKGIGQITRWPLGEASLTPQPAEPNNIASVKSITSLSVNESETDVSIVDDSTKSGMEYAERDITAMALSQLFEKLMMDYYQMASSMGEMEDDEEEDDMEGSMMLSDEYLTKMMTSIDMFAEKAKKYCGLMKRPMKELDTIPHLFGKSKAVSITQFERQLRDVVGYSRKEAKILASVGWKGLCDADLENDIEVPQVVEVPDVDNERKQLLRGLMKIKFGME